MTTSSRASKKAGMTTLELAVVLFVIIALVSILSMGTRAWRKGSDRTACISNIRIAQQVVRGYQNRNHLAEGAKIDMFALTNHSEFGRIGSCPAGGDYEKLGRIPPIGTLVMSCSLAASSKHVPDSIADW